MVAEIKDPSVENQEFPFNPEVDQDIAMHATATARDFFLAPFRSIHLHFLHKLSGVSPVLAVDNTGVWVSSQNKIGHPAHRYRQLMQVPEFIARGM